MQAMTPEYASPEQLGGGNVTTASDVYSLGVLLYRLLTGHRPYALESRSIDELWDQIRNRPPRRPSTVIRVQRGWHHAGIGRRARAIPGRTDWSANWPATSTTSC